MIILTTKYPQTDEAEIKAGYELTESHVAGKWQ